MGIESPGRKPPQPDNLSSLSRDELLARALKAEGPDELAKINDALGALKEQGTLKTEPAEAPAYKEVKIEKTKHARIVVKNGEHYVIGKARNAIIAVEPGGKVTIDDATNTRIFKTEGAEIQISQQRNVVIHTGKEAIKGVIDLGGNPKKNREEKPKPAGEARREEPTQTPIEEKDTITPSEDDTEPAKAHTEEKKPEAGELPQRDIIELIKDASARGDAEEIRRLTALLRGSPSETKEPEAVNLEKAKEETPLGAFENAQTFEELFRAIDQKGAIQGTKQTFTPEELKRTINDVREGRLDIYYVTRARGLRLKVYELLEKEKAAQEKDEGVIREPEADAAKKEDEIHGDETPREDAVHEAPREERGARDEPKSAEDRERAKEAEEGGPVSFETRFRDSFGIAPQELRRIPGYADLTKGQKEMVFENLRQMTLGRIQEEAGKAYRTNTAQAKFFGRIWQGASKRYQIAKLEKAHAEEFSYGGMEAHGKILAELVRGAKDGPEALRNADGSLDIRFVSEKTLEDLAGAPLTERAKKSAEEFNTSSSLFARIPHEWSLASASRSERKQYETAKKRYEAARGSLLQEMDRTNGRRRALEDTLALDQKVQMMQFLTTHPEVERELQKIESKHLWARALANTITEKGVYALFGTVSRTVAVGMLGAIGAPLAAAGMGGLVARGRAKETLREDARLARKGGAKMETSTLYRPARDSEGNIIRNLDGSIKQEFAKQVRRESRDYVKADVLAKRLESLIYKSHIYGPKGDLAARQLDRLLQYADEKLKSGLINFGAREEGIKSQFELVKELGMARAKLGARNQKSEAYARLDAALKGRKEKISSQEKKYVRGQMLRGALLAGGFAGAGRAVAEYFYAGNRSPFMPPDEEAEIGREIKKATGAEMRGISAPPETPFATPDEEAEIGRAIREATGAEMRGALEFTPEQLHESVKSGDSVWKNAERKLDTLFHNKFSDLDPARKTFVIDAIKDEVADRMKAQGLNPDKLQIGQELDYTGILDNKEKMDSIFARANDLDDAVRENIVKNNKMIADWVGEHPREALTSERVEEILRAKATRPEIPTDYMHDSGPMRHESFYNGVSLAEADAYGSREGAFFGKLAGLSDIEYRVIRAQTVGKILAEIPSRAEAEAIYQGGIPGRTIDLPYLEQYDRQEFEGHIRLAELIRHYIEQNPHKEYFMDMEVDDFFKAAAPEEGPVFRGALEPGFLEPEEFAQNPQPIEHSSGKFADAPYSAEYTPADEFVGTTKIAGEDIKKFGSAAEAFIAKERLGMVPQEWNKIKSILVGELLKKTPDGGHAMDEETLSRWYESKRPALPEEYRFLSFKRYALLADAFRTMLAGHSERAYLEELPVAELAKIFVLQATK